MYTLHRCHCILLEKILYLSCGFRSPGRACANSLIDLRPRPLAQQFPLKSKLWRHTDHVTTQISLQCDFLTLKITLLRSSDVQILYPWLCRCCCAIYLVSDCVSIRTTFDHVVEDCCVLRRHRAFTLSLFVIIHWLKKSHPHNARDPIHNKK